MSYIEVCDVRAEGINEKIATDSKVQSYIDTWCEVINRYCGQWFELRNIELNLDGTGTNYLFLPVPIINLEELKINKETSVYDALYYQAYDGRTQMQDDRQNPKIVLTRGIFLKGHRNQYLKGDFGYVDENGETPEAIKRALLLLVVEKLLNPIINTSESQLWPSIGGQQGNITEEVVDEHSVKYSSSPGSTSKAQGRRSWASGLTTNPEVIDLLHLHMSAMEITEAQSYEDYAGRTQS